MNIQKKDIFDDSEKNNVLEKVSALKDLATQLRNNIKELHALKKSTSEASPSLKLKVSENFYALVNTRKHLRETYLEIEKNRIRSQIEKEKIDQLSNYLECIIYQKNNIEREIIQCKNAHLPNLERLDKFYKEVSAKQDELEDEPMQKFQGQMMEKFSDELEARKKLKTEYQNDETEKNKLSHEYDEKVEFLKHLPANLKNVSDACKPLQELFKVSQSMNFDQIQLARNLPDQLYNVYAKLATVRNSNLDQRFDINVIDGNEFSDANTEKIEFHDKQLLLLIEKADNDASLNDYAKIQNDPSMSFLKDVYPLKFRILYLKNFKTVIVTLDSRNFFVTEEILSQLVQNDAGTKIFYDPKSEEERNINNKYSVFGWIQTLASKVQFRSVEAQQDENTRLLGMIQKIRDRVNNKLWLNYQYDTIKKTKKIISPLTDALKYRPILLNFENLLNFDYEITSIKRGGIDDFLALLGLPAFIKKNEPSNTDANLISEGGIINQINEISNMATNYPYISKYGISQEEFFKRLTGVELYDKNQNPKESFYKFEIHIAKYRVHGVIKVDHDYPNKPSQFRLRFGKAEKQKAVIPASIAKKFVHNNMHETKSTSEKAPALSNKIREKVEDFVNTVEASIKDNYMLLSYQLVKLLIALNKITKLEDEMLTLTNAQKLSFISPFANLQ